MKDRRSGEQDKKRRFEAEALVHLDALRRTALRMTKNENEADDLVQDTFMKAYRQMRKDRIAEHGCSRL